MRTNLVQTLKVGAKRINLNRTAMRVALIGLFISLGIGNAWGSSHDTHTATLNVNKGTGNGTVYASTSATATSGSASASFNCGGNEDGQHTGTLYAYATPASGYTFLGWTTSASSSAGADNSNPKGVAFDVTDGSSTQTLYAHFVEKAKVNITFEAPSNGTYTIAVNGGSAETVSSADVVKNNVEGVVLTATPASGYAFAGWYKLNSAGEFVEDLSIDSPYDASFTASGTIRMGARFVPVTLGKFILKGSSTQYYGLKMATIAAGGSGTIVPVADETLVDGSDLMPFDNGTYTIKAGATLLVPHTADNKMQLEPDVVTTAETLSAYRTLVLKNGVKIVSNGNICVGGKIMSAGGGNKSAYVTGPCGVINMANGGHIELNSGAKLYCWGFIKGQDMDQGNNTVGVGTITAHSGAIIKEDFSVGDWRGGTATSNIYNKRTSWKLFPFQSYSIQNVEVPTTYEYGSTLNTFVVVNGGGGNNPADFDIAGSSNTLFLLRDAQSTVRKWYDPTTDLTCYELSGTAQLDALNLVVYISVSSSEYYLPISNSMHIILKNCNMTLSKPMTMQAGSVIEIKEDATANLEARMHMFDKDDWGLFIHNYYFRSFNNLTSHKNRGAEDSKDGLEDAKIIVDGTLNVVSGKGYLYSTNGGANIMGNDGGKVVFGGALPSSTTLHHVTVGTKDQGYIVDAPNDIAAANLCNEDGSYTKSIASKTFLNIHGRWFNQTDGASAINADHTYNFTYIASGAVSGTGGTDVSPNTHNAVYAPDKTGLTAGMKWCNVEQDGTCSNIYNATQALNETPASDIRYTYPSSSWLQLLRTETEGVYGGSDNSLYAVDGCAVNSLGSVDENCLYTINDVKKALVDGHFVALVKNDDDEAFHNTANIEDYYISFEGCTWHPATKEIEEKAYTVEGGIYIWYGGDWKLVEREAPYFFDYNDQNVKRYYEYEDGAWVLASPRVRVQDAIETRDFYFWPEAFAIANSKKNATITLLKNVSSATSPLSFTAKNTTCTLDLNGHTASLTITASGNSANLFAINASNSTFTITDNSANQDGVLDITTSLKVTSTSYHTRGIALVDGALILNAGTVRLSNTYAYTDTKNSGMIKGINVAAGKSFTMNGGAVYAESPYYPRAINIEGSASANATVTINNGTISANATSATSAMGIYSIGGTLNVKPGVTINATTTTESAYGIYIDASTNGYFGTLNMTGGTINATATTKTAIGVYTVGVYISNNTTPNTFGANYKAVANISDGEFNVKTLGTTTAYGVQSSGTTKISGGTFTVAPKSSTAIGVYVLDGTTTIEGNPTFDVTATTIAYGIQAGAQPVEKTGRPYNGKVIVKGGTFNVSTTSKTIAYGVYVKAATRNTTNTASGYYPGHYASAGKATIEGGEFNVTSKTTTAYGILVERATPLYDGEGNIDAYAQGEAIIKGGSFTVVGTTTASSTPTTDAIRAYGDVTISGGEFEVTAPGGYVAGLRIFDGKTTISGNPTFTVRGSTYAYGAYVTGDAPTSLGFISNAELEINNGSFDVATTGTTYAYGALVNPVAPVATEDPEVFYKSPSTLTINDGHFIVKAQTTTAQGVNCSRGYLMAGTLPNTLLAENLGTAHINGGTFDVSTLGTTTAQGVTNSGNMTIGNATFNVTPKSTTAYGARCYHGLLTINEGTVFNVKATNTAYGIVAGNEQPTTKGLLYDAEVVINGGTINVETTSKATIYGLWASRNSRAIATGTANEGNYASAGKITVNGGEIKVAAKTNPAYAVMVDDVVTQSGNADYPAATATPQAFINGGKFYVTATSSKNYAVSATPLAENCQITGGYYNTHTTQTSGTYIDKYIVSPKKKITLHATHPMYVAPNNYRYSVNEGGTVTWKNGDETLKTEMYESGETPAYTGETPTNAEDASYTYTHNGWDPTIAEMANADQTYSATFNHFEKKYTVNVAAGANGSVSPSSVSNIGCETASGDITATPNPGYQFAGWTLPAGVTAADGYTLESNPIHIHATASGKTITANFAAKTYTVTLDNQSATTAGAASVTATYNEAMPSIAANLPARTGYAFGGYFSETNGGGTQYYNADGSSAHIWDIDAVSPILYAKWTVSAVDRELDIIEWTVGASGSIKINGNGLRATTAGTGTNWIINVGEDARNFTKVDRNSKTRVLEVTGLNLTSGEDLLIQMKDKDGNVESMHSYRIPYIDDIPSAGTNNVVYVKNDMSVDATSKPKLAALYINPGAKLTIASGTLSVGKLVLRTLPWESAVIEGEFEADDIYYTRIGASGESIKGYNGFATYTYTPSSYYLFGLPADCDVEEVLYSNGEQPVYGTNWVLKSYNEKNRAKKGKNEDGSNWEQLSGSGTITAGVGYEMMSVSTYYQEFYFPISKPSATRVAVAYTTKDEGAKPKQSGWNYVTSPLMTAFPNAAEPEGLPITWLDEEGTYIQGQATSILPARPFSYQAEGEGYIDFSGESLAFVPKDAAGLRRRVAATAEKTEIEWIHLDVVGANGQGDETTIYSHPTRYEQSYKIGIDVEKQSLTASRAILYSSHAYGDMAFAGVADALLEQGVALTVYSPSAQELTISMRENDWLNRMAYVLLIDHETGMQVNLLNSDYTFDAAEGTTAGRFIIRGVFLAPQVTTDLSGAGVDGERARKLMIDQKIYIEVDGRLYDATGKLVNK